MRLIRAGALAVLLTVTFGGSAAYAAGPGSLDTSFGGGIVGLASGTQLFGVGVEPSGAVVAAGQSGGSVLVECFSASGTSTGTYMGGAGTARAVAIQPDGQAVVAGTSGGMFVQRFNPNCTPDSSFNGGKPALASPLGSGAIGNGVAVAPNGSIVASGSAPFTDPTGESTRTAVARFTSGGALDSSFGSGGAEVIDHGLHYATATAVAVQSDSKLVLAGDWRDPGDEVTSGWIERLTAAGQDDPTFASSGVYFYGSSGSGYAAFNALAIQTDGKILAAGSDLAPPPGVSQGASAAFLRLNPDGTPDTGFGSGGVAKLSAGTFTPDPYGAYGVGIAGGGRVVGAGAMLEFADHDAGLWALTPAGAPDSEGAFGPGATVVQPKSIEACGLAVAPDGSLVMVGDSVSPTRQGPECVVNSTSNGFVARYVGFGPPPVASAPTVVTGAASGISETVATVSGTLNPNGSSTSYHFDYGTSTAYGSSTSSQDAGSGSSTETVTAQLSGLTPDTTYHYRLVAANSGGAATGADATFTTAGATAPSARTSGANGVGKVSATVTGQVTTGGLPTSYHFDYGTSTTYGAHTQARQLQGASAPVGVSAVLTNLRPNTTYHYRLVASNSDGTSTGSDRTFRTLPRISVALRGLRKSYSVGQLGAGGLALKISCSQPCRIKGSILIPAKTVERLHLGSHALALGSGSLKLARGGKGTVHLHFTRQGKQFVARAGRLADTLRIASKPLAGGPTVTLIRTVTIGP